jgi:2-iminobutanoate/2-iminopropanoate deaminase
MAGKQAISVGPSSQAPSHFSPGIAVEAHGRLVFVSAMTARRSDGHVIGVGDVAAQTRQVCENIKAVLQAAGGTLKDVCEVTVYLRHMSDRERVNAVRREFFGSPPPASTVVEVTKLASPEFLVEISAVALVPTPTPTQTPTP